jgi:predicted GIY-YIG superfamily endonuclease
MPCSICKLSGHNSRTCISSENIDKKVLKPELNKKYYCYILQQTDRINSLNYVGYTVNFNRRIRQHNELIKGGAFYTKRKGPWQFLAVMTCSSWNNIRALQVEWLTKHPTRKRKRPRCFTGSSGRIKSLVEIFKRVPIEEQINVFVHPNFYSLALELDFPDNITLRNNLLDL